MTKFNFATIQWITGTHSLKKIVSSNTTHTIEIHDKYRFKKVVAIGEYCNVSHCLEIPVSLLYENWQ